MEKNRKVDFPVSEQKRKAFAQRLKKAMKGKFTQETLADEIGVSVSGIKKWFSGVTDPSLSRVALAADACGVSLDWLAFGRGFGPSDEEHLHNTVPDAAQEEAMSFREPESSALDENVLHATIEAVETDLHERGETMSPSDKSRLIYLLYRTRMKEKDQSLTKPRPGLGSLFGKSPNGRTGRNNTPDEFLEIPQRQPQRKKGNGD